MEEVRKDAAQCFVALLAEGVDRNPLTAGRLDHIGGVALLAEGVDRNLPFREQAFAFQCRPPRGGRG